MKRLFVTILIFSFFALACSDDNNKHEKTGQTAINTPSQPTEPETPSQPTEPETPSGSPQTECLTTFVYYNEYTSLASGGSKDWEVYLIGSFNTWKQSDPQYRMNSNGYGENRITVNLPLGSRIEYKYHIPGWLDDGWKTDANDGTSNGQYTVSRCDGVVGTPQTHKINGLACLGNSECQSLNCTNNVCTGNNVLKGNGEQCQNASECASGYCGDGTCADLPPAEDNLENNAERCSDGIDNDKNGQTDCEEQTCAEFENCKNPLTKRCIEGLDPATNGMGIDPNKKQFTFDENLKWNDLYNELSKGNYSVKIENKSIRTYYDENGKPDPSTAVENFGRVPDYLAVDGDKYYLYQPGYESFEYAYIQNNDVVDYSYESTEKHNFSKCPKFAFYDTFVAPTMANIFASLTKSEDGGFAESYYISYYYQYGYFEIKDNSFILTVRDYINHPEFQNSEVTVYTFYNIGNTKIDLPECIKLDDKAIESMTTFKDYDYGLTTFRDFDYRGINYSYYYKNEFYTAQTYYDFFDLATVEPGAYILLPEIYGIKVAELTYPFYKYNRDQSGYTLNVYFDKEQNYQGEYSHLGAVKPSSSPLLTVDPLNYFIECGGIVKYYGEW